MKQLLLAAALVMVSTAAMADRTVSATSEMWMQDRSSETKACQSAKSQAENKARDNEQVESFSSCKCEPDTKGAKGTWICSVDATLAKKH